MKWPFSKDAADDGSSYSRNKRAMEKFDREQAEAVQQEQQKAREEGRRWFYEQTQADRRRRLRELGDEE